MATTTLRIQVTQAVEAEAGLLLVVTLWLIPTAKAGTAGTVLLVPLRDLVLLALVAAEEEMPNCPLNLHHLVELAAVVMVLKARRLQPQVASTLAVGAVAVVFLG
jgi:hypothetical protein